MRGLVIAFAVLAAATEATAAAPPDGRTVYRNWCAPCHARVSGTERLPGTSALGARYRDERPAALEDRTDLTPEVVKVFVRQGVKSMPPFRRVEISDSELDALANYLAKAR